MLDGTGIYDANLAIDKPCSHGSMKCVWIEEGVGVR